MASLTHHLNTPGSHGQLAFRRDCPRCRADRLYGPLAERPAVVPRSVQAGLAAAALAATSSPAAALAQDTGPAGGVGAPVAPGDVGPGGGGDNGNGSSNGGDNGNGSSNGNSNGGGLGLGGGADDDDSGGVGVGAPSAPEDDDSEETSGSVPVTTPVGSVSPPESGDEPSGDSASGDGGSEPTRPSRESGESSGSDESSGSGGGAGSGDNEASGSGESSGSGGGGDPNSGDAERQGPDTKRDADKAPSKGDDDGGEVGAPAKAGNSVDNAPVAGGDDGDPKSGDADREDPDTKRDADKTPSKDDDEGGEVGAPAKAGYTVEAGDSLWAIAERVYATDSDAETARAVNRLWKLNGDRIATGDPDLIHPNQELRLR